MLSAQLQSFGHPPDVVSCIETPEPSAPEADQVLIELLAGPVNPAEILLIQGRYASRPTLPCELGIEGVGRVLTTGEAVTEVQAGDLVLSLERRNWTQRLLLNVQQVIKLPSAIDIQQAAMLKVNPATALKMLDDYVDLQAGDWVIQNAANSGVGRSVIQLARSRGLHTVNVVRRESLRESLLGQGADVVVVDGTDLAKQVSEATGGGPIRLAIDAVAGSACERLADCLAEDATVVNYGLLSGQPCQLRADQTVFKGITLTGFWLAKAMRKMRYAELVALYGELADKVLAGVLYVDVEAVYSLRDIKQALVHGMQEGRSGKVLISPND